MNFSVVYSGDRVIAFGRMSFRNSICRRPSLGFDDGKTILIQTLLSLLSAVSLAVYDENRWRQLPVMSLFATTSPVVVRFSVEHLLNSGCLVLDNVANLKIIVHMPTIVCTGAYV